MATVSERPPIPIDARDVGSETAIRLFRLTLNGITVELSSLGASITRITLPDYSKGSPSSPKPKPGEESASDDDDVVLSYASPKDQYDDRNKPFFGAIVGRVANRIKDGRFQLLQSTRQSPGDGGGDDVVDDALETYQLDRNNHPNHLHGGYDGFYNRVWSADVVVANDGASVRFALVSPDGDQGYPGGIRVAATYSLVPIIRCGEGADGKTAGDGARLCLDMRASLLPGETRATPIALAQHTYFNLASHSSPRRILDHTLQLPNCTRFTPLDSTSIPTREVRGVDHSGGKAMDFREGKSMTDALIQYGEERAGLGTSDAMNNVHRILNSNASSGSDGEFERRVARTPTNGGEAPPGAKFLDGGGGAPYGFDHNYAIDDDDAGGLRLSAGSSGGALRLAAVLSHPPTRRSLRVLTSAPGMQLYTSNYLDGTTPPPDLCKDESVYCQWQGICLETQTYPDSIIADGDGDIDREFVKGRCFILRPGGSAYVHAVEYEFRSMP